MNRLQKLEINQYRGLKDMTLENLSRINVLIGKNNSGKTSILEAIGLLTNPFSERVIRAIADQRQRGVSSYALAPSMERLRWLFPQNENELQPIQLTMYLNGEKKTAIFKLIEEKVMSLPPLGEMIIESITSKEVVDLYQKIRVNVNGQEEELHFSVLNKGVKPNEHQRQYSVGYISASEHKLFPASAEGIGQIILDEKEEELISLLQEFDKDINGIKLIPHKERNNIYIQKKGRELVPLFSFGDGLQKVLLIATAILKMQKGILLLDEPEVGIHTKMIPTYFKWLSKLTEQNNVTIFMATHSIEAVDGVLYADKESLENLSFYRLEKERIKRFSGERMYSIRYNSGMEVRG